MCENIHSIKIITAECFLKGSEQVEDDVATEHVPHRSADDCGWFGTCIAHFLGKVTEEDGSAG